MSQRQVPLHKRLVLPLLHAGKDVFVEWPLGNGLAEAEEMAALAKSKGLRTMVGLQARHSTSILKVPKNRVPQLLPSI